MLGTPKPSGPTAYRRTHEATYFPRSYSVGDDDR